MSLWGTVKKVGKAIGGVLDDFPIIGDAIGAATDIFGQSSANKQNKKLAREQMAFQERMSATEVQRRTQDLLAAGMNPMLAYSQGGASSASGARAEVQSVTGRAVNSALAMRAQRASLEQMELQNRLLLAQRGNVESDTNLKNVTAGKVAGEEQAIEAGIQKTAQEVKNLFHQMNLTEEQVRTARLTNDQLEKLQPILYDTAKIEQEAKRLGLSQAEVDAKFAEAFGSESKWIQFILKIIRR